MASVMKTTPAMFAQMIRDLADKVETGTIEIASIVGSNNPIDVSSFGSYHTRIPNPISTVEITYRTMHSQGSYSVSSPMKELEPVRHPMCGCRLMSGDIVTAADWNQLTGATLTTSSVTIDTAEYPMVDSDLSVPDFIKRVLIEMGYSGNYESHRMESRPGKAPMLIVQWAS